MQQCWNSDPSQRPDASLLPKIFEEMMGLCKAINNKNLFILLKKNSFKTFHKFHKIFNKIPSFQYLSLRQNTFRRISRHLSIVETRNHYHSNRHYETIPKSRVPRLHDHWVPRYD